MSIHSAKFKDQRGFTIIELMIATTVLSVILLLVTTMIISIGSLFYKGINQSRVQDGARNLTDEISQRLQLSGTVPQAGQSSSNAAVNVYCIGGTRYTYIANVQIGHQQNNTGPVYNHILWRDEPSAGCTQVMGKFVSADLTLSDPSNGQVSGAGLQDSAELAPANSRLTSFCIGTLNPANGNCQFSSASPYTINVGIAYGDDDLLCDNDSTFPSECSFQGVSPHMTQIFSNAANVIPPAQIICKTTAGDQFCSTAYLTTTVANRLN
jgi:prepilin-type N-terminal cleavage/methylation domain-containing protein